MQSQAVLPALLVFGPQTGLPSLETLAELRQELMRHPQLAGLQKAVKSLPQFWRTLTEFDPGLNAVQGANYLGSLEQWIDHGVFPQYLIQHSSPNIFALPLTVILEIILYVRYLSSLEINDAHHHVLQAIRTGGTQGFCVGFLTAIAVNCSKNEEDMAEIGAVSLRLAVCVGAYVDQLEDGCVPQNHAACIAVRWRTSNQKFKEEEVTNLIQSYSNVSPSVKRPS